MNNEVERIKELIKQINEASDAYYNSSPTMTDYEWDKLIDELKYLEDETGIVYPNSPTQNVGYSVLDEIPKVKHNHPMLSLDKTKSVDDLRKFAGKNACVLSVKCDGLTTSLHYNNGKLISAETRGNGVEGSDVLNNALTIKNIPHEIPYMGDLIIDGEVIIGWDTFNSINEKLPEDQKYKHPRNLVSGSLTLLDSKEAANRNMRFIAWRVIKGFQHKSVLMDLVTAEKSGFESVPAFMYIDKADGERIDELVNKIQEMADNAGIPYDGAVMAVNNYELAESMGRTDGSQSAFTNTSVFDRPYFEALFGGAEFPDGTFMIDYEEEIIEFQKWYMEVMAEIRHDNMFTFPVSTISLLRQNGQFVDEDFARWAVKHNMEWSDSNLFVDDSVNSLSNCCRLKSNIEDLGYFNSIGGTALKVGSVKVSTINLARIALDTNSEEEYLKEVERRVNVNLRALDCVRYIIRRNVEKGLLPNFKHDLVDFDHLYNTIGSRR